MYKNKYEYNIILDKNIRTKIYANHVSFDDYKIAIPNKSIT